MLIQNFGVTNRALWYVAVFSGVVNRWHFCIILSALLVTAVHVEMKLGDNTLE